MTAISDPITTGVQAGVAVHPGQSGSLHLTEIPRREPGSGEALVRIKRVGVCGTDQEIIHAQFGTAPPGETSLVLGHEMLGEIVAVGPDVTGFVPGELVTATVRRPDGCPACQAGQPDMCQWLGYTERGIIGRHGFMTETMVDDVRWLVEVPRELEDIGVLLEPISVVEKALRQANLIQRRISAWNPRTGLVLGAGPIGILATLLLRSRGMEVITMARRPAPHLAAEIIEAAGARYVSVRERSVREVAASLPPLDIIMEATGAAELAFAAIDALGNNGVLVLLSITGGDREIPVNASAVNRGLILGNKVVVGSVNAAREDFELGVEDLRRWETLWPGLTHRLITRRLSGLNEFALIPETPEGDIKTVIEVH